MINRNPELVEKKDPPIITKIKKIKLVLVLFNSKAKPILDILLEIASKLFKKLSLKLKKRKKIVKTIMK